MKLNIKNISNTITKKDDRYTVKDNNYLNNLVVSSTNLHPGKTHLVIFILVKKKFTSLLVVVGRWN